MKIAILSDNHGNLPALETVIEHIEAWQAFCVGSLPIGAAITNPNSDTVSRGRNRIFDKHVEGEYIYNSRAAQVVNILANRL